MLGSRDHTGWMLAMPWALSLWAGQRGGPAIWVRGWVGLVCALCSALSPCSSLPPAAAHPSPGRVPPPCPPAWARLSWVLLFILS